MRHRFLLHSLNHTLLVVDITKIGLPTETYPSPGRQEPVLSIRYSDWKDGRRYFLALGADAELIEKTFGALKKVGVAVLTIV